MRINAQWIMYDTEGKMVYKATKGKRSYDKLWVIRSTIAEQRVGKHDVYWGCHACMLDKIHSGKCECSCGAIPGKSSICWGEDFEGYTEVQRARKRFLMNEIKKYVMDEVDYDLRTTIVNGKYDSSKKGRVKNIKRTSKKRQVEEGEESIDST